MTVGKPGEEVGMAALRRVAESEEITGTVTIDDIVERSRAARDTTLDKDRKSTRLNSSHNSESRMPSSA
jgi:Mg/Co/Ni transporter MgtE